jgi:hypothetical protein
MYKTWAGFRQPYSENQVEAGPVRVTPPFSRARDATGTSLAMIELHTTTPRAVPVASRCMLPRCWPPGPLRTSASQDLKRRLTFLKSCCRSCAA